METNEISASGKSISNSRANGRITFLHMDKYDLVYMNPLIVTMGI